MESQIKSSFIGVVLPSLLVTLNRAKSFFKKDLEKAEVRLLFIVSIPFSNSF